MAIFGLNCQKWQEIGKIIHCAFVEGVSVDGEALVLDHLGRAVLDDFSGLGREHDVPVVQSLDHSHESTQRLRQGEVHPHRDVSAVPLKYFVSLLLQLDDDVPGLLARLVITVSVEGELVVARHASIDVNL